MCYVLTDVQLAIVILHLLSLKVRTMLCGVQVVAGEQRRGHKVMVFCNTLDSCRAADKYLQEQGLPSLSYHGDVPLDGRRQAIQQFAQGAQSDALSTNGSGSSKQPVLVCTDLAAR